MTDAARQRPPRRERPFTMDDPQPSRTEVVAPGALSIVVPLYQEAAGVARLRAELSAFAARERARRRVELVLVDDGSTDGTGAALREAFALDDDVVFAAHPRNRGLATALRTGTERATGRFVAWLDADLSYDPAVLTALCEALDGGADVAVASCYHPGGAVAGVPGWRLALSRLASIGYRALTGGRLHTYTCMVRAARREVMERCWPRRGGFVGVTESLLRALRTGHRVVECPTTLRRRETGVSKLRTARVALGHLGLMAAALVRRI